MNSIRLLVILICSLFDVSHEIRSLEDGVTAVPFLPTVIPLAVRSPYLGAYLSEGPDKDLTEMSPRFWTGSPIGWTGLIRVDGEVFNWMGNLTDWPAADNVHFSHTASASNFTFAIGSKTENDDEQQTRRQKKPVKIYLHVSFLSAITPTDTLRQSLPLSYLSLNVESADGFPHQVELYTDINGLWCADEEDEMIEWDTYSKGYVGGSTLPTWQAMSMSLRNQRLFQEKNDRILHGSVWYSALSLDTDRIMETHTAGEDGNPTRKSFARYGRLDNQVNQTFRQIRSRDEANPDLILDEPVLAYAHSFGFISPQRTSDSRTVLMSIGHIRTSVAQYMTAGEKTVGLEALWTSKFNSVIDLIEYHLFDYHHTLAASQAWDDQVYDDAERVHDEAYGDILSISTRQIFMALEAVRENWKSSDKTNLKARHSLHSDETQTMVMLKEISSNGNCQTVDVITPMLPFLIYAAPQMIPEILEPIYKYISTGLYQPIAAPHDLGDHYPNATGRNDFIYSNLPLEESGNMICLALSCLRLKTCEDQIKKYYQILVQWSDWLIENTLYPDDQRSTDDFFGPTPNQTSLVVKGILGLRAMSEISEYLGHVNDSLKYLAISTRYCQEFLKLAVSDDRTHLLGSYGNQSSWSTQYNLYFDKLFMFEMFPDWVYDMQDQWYLVQAGDSRFGTPLDSRSKNRAKTDWLMWAGGCARLNETRRMFVNGLTNYIRQTENSVFGDLITLKGGWSVGFLTRPVVGGHFSLVALDIMKHYRSKSSHKMILGKIDLDEILEKLSKSGQKIVGYTKTIEGKSILLGIMSVLFIGLVYWILLRLKKIKRNFSRGRYKTINDDEVFDNLSLRSTHSLIRNDSNELNRMKNLNSQYKVNDEDQSLNIQLLENNSRDNNHNRVVNNDEEVQFGIGSIDDQWDIGLQQNSNESTPRNLVRDDKKNA